MPHCISKVSSRVYIGTLPTIKNLVFHFWAQKSDREVPPTSVQNESLARQADDFIRSVIHWKGIRAKSIWQARLGVIREIIDFEDPIIKLQALTSFWTIQGDIEATWAWHKRHQLQLGLGHSWMTAHADAYTAPPQQNRTAPFLAYKYQFGNWRLQVNLRQEIVDGKFIQPTPALGINGQLTTVLSLHGKVSRNYRLPTFNDLYWQPGGNPDLLPESGWSQELGLAVKPVGKTSKWSYTMTAFNRKISNWILWSKIEGQSFWSSNNIAKVWSRGLEQRLQWQWDMKAVQIQLQAGYDYILSTNEIALDNPRLAAGSQLIYVPKHQAYGRISLQWKQVNLLYRHSYTGTVAAITQNSWQLIS